MTFDKRGSILIASFWILTIISIFAIGIGFRTSLETRLNKYNMDRLKALYLAKAGIVKSQELLLNDKNNYDSIYECGIALSEEDGIVGNPENIFVNIELGEGRFRVSYKIEDREYAGMSDEERRININRASLTTLEKLLGRGNETVASYIVDWRGSKNADFNVPEELLLVKGMTQEIFDEVKDYVTIYGDGKVNVNTASKRVLVALGMTDELADKIIRFRSSSDGMEGTKDDIIFINIDIERALPNLSNDEVLIIGNLKNYFTIKSDYFRIESKGAIGKASSNIEKGIVAIMKRDAERGGLLISYREY